MKIDDSALIRSHIFVEGRVQGVGFRYFTLENANRYGIKGWVRNTFKDQVEIVAEGTQDQMDQFISSVRRGPGGAFVQEMKIEKLPSTGEFKRFSVISTG